MTTDNQIATGTLPSGDVCTDWQPMGTKRQDNNGLVSHNVGRKMRCWQHDG